MEEKEKIPEKGKETFRRRVGKTCMSSSLYPGELVMLTPGQYIRIDGKYGSGPYTTLNSKTSAVLVEFQGKTSEKSCWTVLASNEILMAWEDNLSRT